MTRISRKNKEFIVFHFVLLLMLNLVVGSGCTSKNPKTNNEEKSSSEVDTVSLHINDSLIENQIEVVSTVDSEKIDTFYNFSKQFLNDLIFISLDSLSHVKIGSVEIKSKKLKDDFYTFEIIKGDEAIYKSNDIAGISPLWKNDIYLLFCVYSSITEDGSTEGIPLIVNLQEGSVEQGKKIYSDCLNPILFGSDIFLIESLTLHILDINLNERFQKNIEFIDAKKEVRDYRYLDRFQFCYLNVNKGLLFIGFKEERTSTNCTCFSGEISKNSDKILLTK
jgi:hypothetical protein